MSWLVDKTQQGLHVTNSTHIYTFSNHIPFKNFLKNFLPLLSKNIPTMHRYYELCLPITYFNPSIGIMSCDYQLHISLSFENLFSFDYEIY